MKNVPVSGQIDLSMLRLANCKYAHVMFLPIYIFALAPYEQ